MPRKLLLLFDLDGTLIDSAPDLQIAANAMLAELGLAPLELQEVRRMVGDGAAKLVSRVLAARPGPAVDETAALARFLALYEAAPAVLTRPYPGVDAALEHLAGMGATLTVCTNKPARTTGMILAALGLDRWFVRIMAGDTLPWRKPDPRMLTHLADAFPDLQAVMIGDSEVDAAAAAAASMPFVLMTHGYRRGPVEAIKCMAALDSFEQIPATLAAAFPAGL
jgi:phosphoglycolate phosphatase